MTLLPVWIMAGFLVLPTGDAAGAPAPGWRAGWAGWAAVVESRPDTAPTIQRGYALLDSGRVAAGRAVLMRAAGTLIPAEATRVIRLAGLLGRLSPETAALMARGGVLAYRKRGVEAAHLLEAGVDSLVAADSAGAVAAPPNAATPPPKPAAPSGTPPAAPPAAPVPPPAVRDRPAVLAEAARMAEDMGTDSLAARLRGRILHEDPHAPEVPEAALALARYRARTPEGRPGALALLTDLVTGHPDDPMVPQAREEIQRIQRLEALKRPGRGKGGG